MQPARIRHLAMAVLFVALVALPAERRRLDPPALGARRG